MAPTQSGSFAGFNGIKRRSSRNAAILIALNGLLQLLLWFGILPADAKVAGLPLFAVMELGLVLLLLLNGYRIWRWCVQTDPALPLRSVAALCWAGLLLCFCGDIVNKNFAGLFYQYDTVIEHSYLIDSIVFFFPGYALLLLAMWVAVRDHLSQRLITRSLVLAAGVGVFATISLRQSEMNLSALALMTVYSVLICGVGVGGWWLLKTFGKERILLVASGAMMATLADAIIGRFWIADASFYPDIRYLNWVIYFTSQALLQQLPLRLAQVEIEAEQAALDAGQRFDR